ncbi:hypothetical protein [Bythopirellula goksoeyrii]|uniref:PEP-CTERM protein-sorting domain-containing protein n=1 Tax=Bythopirellula goksoeyrii TaxID=1400387 RepID=A0A5B9QPW8_9BACT|nr:hypothetical protein [Bythopirellula goksoeyrii]QEG36013.1 hypothetical protein Pr1d_33220 [Bythopirellula goksoeyrii]
MKKITFFAIVLIACSRSSLATASVDVGDTIRFQNREGTTAGGEFGLQKETSPGIWSGDLFRTFCLERDETIGFGTPYTVDSISSTAHLGGQNTNSGDPISAQTAWLFYNFTLGTLTGYDYTPNSAARIEDANRLQNAFWKFEGEDNNISGALDVPDAEYWNLANAWFGSASDADKLFYTSRVMVINPVQGNTPRQSMLYVVPEASTIAVWSILSLVGAGVACRKNSEKIC